MALDAIAALVKVVEAGSFSAAARRLGMPKTTVSAKVAGLEKRRWAGALKDSSLIARRFIETRSGDRGRNRELDPTKALRDGAGATALKA